MTLVSMLCSLSDISLLGIFVGHSKDRNKARPVMIFNPLLCAAVFSSFLPSQQETVHCYRSSGL